MNRPCKKQRNKKKDGMEKNEKKYMSGCLLAYYKARLNKTEVGKINCKMILKEFQPSIHLIFLTIGRFFNFPQEKTNVPNSSLIYSSGIYK